MEKKPTDHVEQDQPTAEDDSERGFMALIQPYEAGQDEFWDQLGESWYLVEHLTPESVKVYVRWGDGSESQPSAISGLCVSGGPVTARLIRSIQVGRLEMLRPNDRGFPTGFIRNELAPLRRDKAEDPEQFAARVAMYYSAFSRVSSKPAKEIADHSGVPVTTVRGWIREARLRGKLPPGTRGKAG